MPSPATKAIWDRVARPVRDHITLWLSTIEEPSYYRWKRKHAGRLRQFKNCHAGQDCFIIGNGPSLNKMDLSALQDYHTFGLNKIYLMFDRGGLNLSYHVAVNPLVIQQSHAAFGQLRCPSFLSYAASPPALTLNAQPFQFFLYTSGQTLSFAKDLEDRVNEGWTVTYVALQIAYYMGFRRVFLIGVDHNFKTNGSPNEKQVLSGPDPNHFDPNYFGGQEWHLPDLDGSEMAYRLAHFHFARSERTILDATLDGKLDVFPKIGFDVALQQARKKN